jgi:hypothetical protein
LNKEKEKEKTIDLNSNEINENIKDIIYINKPEMSDISPLDLNNVKLKNNENFMPDYYFMRYRKLLFIKKYNQNSFKFDVANLFSY